MRSEDVNTRFYLCAASLLAKRALPHATQAMSQAESWLSNLTHDALVLSQMFARTPEGLRSIQNGELTRYWYVIHRSC